MEMERAKSNIFAKGDNKYEKIRKFDEKIEIREKR